MPDLERFTRSLEIDLADTPEQKAYVQGIHDGKDNARKEIILLLVVAILAVTVITALF